MKIEWGIEKFPDWYDKPTPDFVPMVSEEVADAVVGQDQFVVFRYVGDWTRA